MANNSFKKWQLKAVKAVCQYFDWEEGSEQFNELFDISKESRIYTLNQVTKIINSSEGDIDLVLWKLKALKDYEE